jgi:predicted double-glycine peptidase
MLVLFLLSSGCATVDNVSEVQRRSDLHLVRNVPFFPQEDYQCGPASLAAVLNYQGASATSDEVARAIYSRSARGTLNIDMVLYAQSRGLRAAQYKGGLDDLREQIDAGRPLIVLVDYGFSVIRADHFMVVVGYNDEGVIVNSGRQEGAFIAWDDFVRAWEKTGYWTLLVQSKATEQ